MEILASVQNGSLRLPKGAEEAWEFERYRQLTMPPGALDALMRPTLKILAQRNNKSSRPLTFGFLLFAGDHAVARAHGVSAFPSEVTPQMVANIAAGGAAISQLTARRQAPLCVCDVGVAQGHDSTMNVAAAAHVTVTRANVQQAFPEQGYEHGARDITQTSALSLEAHTHCWNVGMRLVDEMLAAHPCDVIGLGEMGIGNTTPATAIAAVLTRRAVGELVGRGTGLDDEGLKRKALVIQSALQRVQALQLEHAPRSLTWAHTVLSQLGGAELSALAGAAWRAAERGVVVLLDGLIVTAAVAPFAMADGTLAQWLMVGHESAEKAHSAMLKELKIEPLLKLGLRLGEGSGAAIAAGLLQDADALVRHMATFASAGVSAG